MTTTKRKKAASVDLSQKVMVELTLGQALWCGWKLACWKKREQLAHWTGGEPFQTEDDQIFRQVLAAFEKVDGLPEARVWVAQTSRDARGMRKKAKKR